MDAPVAERHPGRTVPPVAGTAAIGAVVDLMAAAIEEGRRPLLDERQPGRHPLTD
ncbi:hypothetical protein ACIPC1_11985 [Streptomyces sp. NPDC087263]|uniref:hypothetical protein n=1 Tax=Streptomyces sp. NPDC087263 TaxID=3365773 RepID=UPI003802D7B9